MLRSLLVNVPTTNAMKSIDPMSWILICYSINLHLERHLDDAMMVLWLLRKICLYGIFFYVRNYKIILQNSNDV